MIFSLKLVICGINEHLCQVGSILDQPEITFKVSQWNDSPSPLKEIKTLFLFYFFVNDTDFLSAFLNFFIDFFSPTVISLFLHMQ